MQGDAGGDSAQPSMQLFIAAAFQISCRPWTVLTNRQLTNQKRQLLGGINSEHEVDTTTGKEGIRNSEFGVKLLCR